MKLSTQVYTSAISAHPEQTGDNYVSYTVIHNFGKPADQVTCYAEANGAYQELNAAYRFATTMYGYNPVGASTQAKSYSTVFVFRVDAGTKNIKFKAFSHC